MLAITIKYDENTSVRGSQGLNHRMHQVRHVLLLRCGTEASLCESQTKSMLICGLASVLGAQKTQRKGTPIFVQSWPQASSSISTADQVAWPVPAQQLSVISHAMESTQLGDSEGAWGSSLPSWFMPQIPQPKLPLPPVLPLLVRLNTSRKPMLTDLTGLLEAECKLFSETCHWMLILICIRSLLIYFHSRYQPCDMAMGQNPVPPVNIPIPTKLGSIMGGAPKTPQNVSTQVICRVHRTGLRPRTPRPSPPRKHV